MVTYLLHLIGNVSFKTVTAVINIVTVHNSFLAHKYHNGPNEP
jgi:hypothetical protein